MDVASSLRVFAVAFGPPPAGGIPQEKVRVTIRPNGNIYAVPVGAQTRRWLHRYPRASLREIVTTPGSVLIPWERLLGSLCLWYPRHPDHLRWEWRDGFAAYLRLVQRHLWSEEYWRQHGQ
jgi:hypothetical protein